MIIVTDKISRKELSDMCGLYGFDMVKAVADINNGILAVDAELHADLERLLLSEGSIQDDLWGFNIYPGEEGDDMVEFDSLINIRTRQNNRTRYVDDENVRNAIYELVKTKID